MSLQLPSRRAARSAAVLVSSPRAPSDVLTSTTQRRSVSIWDIRSWTPFRKDATNKNKNLNPLTEEYLRKKPTAASPPKRGDLSTSSIFEDEKIAGPKPDAAATKGGQKHIPRDRETMAASLDPDPKSRLRWERKMVIRDITRRGRMTKTEQLKKEERVLQAKSHDFKTSVKKLLPLAKQITGKTVEDAIVQMRFSKKKAAKDVKEHLEYARNQAIVKRGMGLGLGVDEKFQPRIIMTKDGKRVKVTNPTTLWVEQAWCGRGPFGTTPDYRARGQINMMRNPTTGLTLVLKEEKTRIRLHEEREAKEARRKVWVQLPNRPITAQRQYYSW
ncbi:hypothetical protein LZ554_007262 [Drepanopeziza brunnea f. sp. 'monogermtubi']|nr:hypothetical protein LZ554_007262 [Drepanopeziza brunnea f. sp. 'monogermtubi']